MGTVGDPQTRSKSVVTSGGIGSSELESSFVVQVVDSFTERGR